MKIKILEGEFCIYKTKESPAIDKSIFCFIQEIDGFSIITFAYKGEYSPIFKAFYLDGLDDLNESGILYKVLKPLKENNISVLVISALNRDYIFIHKRDFNKAIKLMGMK
ncbi:ACT domain-containing protein [Helicobacter apodemus]|uniref:ACT domain-containing protein n=1 Tax=Helicobacter apodemus TaxID=135569 RepID=A0A4V6I6D4_9HELI|nr:ACT domain-containing protein [Helicobacter apodemus]TLE12996.1 ACT domain-containing protein [Helicobacter apodemus]